MSKKKILFYYPSNNRTVALETLLIQLRNYGYEIVILTTCTKGDFHYYMESLNFPTHTNHIETKGIRYYIRQIHFLISFCRKQEINFVFSHLQHVNFIAVLTQYFIKVKVVVFRHHFRFIDTTDKEISASKNEVFFDRVINKLAQTIIVPSTGVYEGIKTTEKISINKLQIIPYLYDFSKYQTPKDIEVEKIRAQYSCKLRLIMVSRLIKLKRHYVVFPVIKNLILEGYDIKLLVLDEGPEKENLTAYINQNKLADYIFMLGYKKDFVNYMAAADLLIQPSLTDASNSVAKEMALFKKAIAVSKDVGDYSDYVRDNINGYLLPTSNTSAHLKETIIDAYNNSDKLITMGENLKKDVFLKFDVTNADDIIEKYIKLLQ